LSSTPDLEVEILRQEVKTLTNEIVGLKSQIAELNSGWESDDGSDPAGVPEPEVVSGPQTVEFPSFLGLSEPKDHGSVVLKYAPHPVWDAIRRALMAGGHPNEEQTLTLVLRGHYVPGSHIDFISPNVDSHLWDLEIYAQIIEQCTPIVHDFTTNCNSRLFQRRFLREGDFDVPKKLEAAYADRVGLYHLFMVKKVRKDFKPVFEGFFGSKEKGWSVNSVGGFLPSHGEVPWIANHILHEIPSMPGPKNSSSFVKKALTAFSYKGPSVQLNSLGKFVQVDSIEPYPVIPPEAFIEALPLHTGFDRNNFGINTYRTLVGPRGLPSFRDCEFLSIMDEISKFLDLDNRRISGNYWPWHNTEFMCKPIYIGSIERDTPTLFKIRWEKQSLPVIYRFVELCSTTPIWLLGYTIPCRDHVSFDRLTEYDELISQLDITGIFQPSELYYSDAEESFRLTSVRPNNPLVSNSRGGCSEKIA
jgi:hypothetical protein